MIRPEFKKSLEGQQQVLVVLWAVFVWAIFVYLGITHFILMKSDFAPGGSYSETLRVVLWALAFIDVATLVWWRKNYLTREAILGGAKQYKLLQSLQGHTNTVEERAAAIVSSYVTSKIVVFAIIEALAVYGFVLAVVGRFLPDQYLFSLASGVLLLLEFPSKARLQELLRESEAFG
ncbi:MAG: hypothetical protein ACREQK_12125 [Candidatus Binatia bacterium]